MNKINIEQKKLYRILGTKGKQLIHTLESVRNERLNKKQELWRVEYPRRAEPEELSTREVAEIMNEFFMIIVLGNINNSKLVIYDSSKGIYTQNDALIYYYISVIEPDYTLKKSDEVIFHIRNMIFSNTIHYKTRDKHLIPVKNGIYNTQTRKLEPFTPEYIFTTIINTKYVEHAKHPDLDGFDFDKWLLEIANNDKQVVELLWQVINESLNGNYTRKKAFFLVGSGNNGKGTFQELLSNIVGRDNIASLKAHEFDERFSLEALIGKTLVIGDDVPPHVFTKDLSNLKSIITGDPVKIEEKNKPIFHDVLTPTIIQSSNGMFRTSDKSDGLLRRLVIVPFLAKFESGKTENSKIKEVYFKDERLLEYVMSKALRLDDFDAFIIPDVSKKELDTFKIENDPVYEFAIEIMLNWDLKHITKSIVFETYTLFCEINGYKPLSSRKFHKQLLEHLESKGWTDGSKHMSITDTKITCPLVEFVERHGYNNILNFSKEKPKPHKCYINPNGKETVDID